MKRTLSLILALLLCLSLGDGAVLAAEETPTAASAPAPDSGQAEIAAPVLQTITNTVGGVYLSWSASAGAELYRVFRQSGGSGWNYLADTYATEYTDGSAESGVTYTYTVRCVSADGYDFTSSYDRAGLTITYIAAPVITALSSDPGGVSIAWAAVPGAENYCVFRRRGGENWTRIGDTAGTSLTDTDFVLGADYVYTVRCVSADGAVFTSAYYSGEAVTAWASPVLLRAAGTADGIQVTWQKTSGAEGYNIYRRTAAGSWEKIAVLTGGDTVSYIDGSAVSGEDYIYTVRAYSGGLLSPYDANGVSVHYIAAPVIADLSNAAEGVAVTWGAVCGAEQYRVFRRQGDGKWSLVGDTADTSLIDAQVEPGVTYTYTVRCLSADGAAHTSAYNDGDSITAAPAPVLTGAVCTTGGVQVRWQAISCAEGYTVYRRTPDSGWKKLAVLSDGSAASYTDGSAVSGEDYIYTVRARIGDLLSAYDRGLSVRYLSAPVISSLSSTEEGVAVAWDAVPGAENYRVFRRSGDGSWSWVGDTADTSLTDTEAVPGVSLTYTVRCLSADGSAFTSAFIDGAAAITWLAAPPLRQAVTGARGVTLRWDAVAGAEQYRIYRRTPDSGWILLHETVDSDALTYTDADGREGTEYIYAVRAVRGDAMSGFVRPGIRQSGWYEQDGEKHYVRRDGTAASGWLSDGGQWYYFSDEGAMVTGWRTIDGKDYYFYAQNDENGGPWGAMAADTEVDGYVIQADGSAMSGTERYMRQRAQGYSSATSYLILVDTSACRTGVFRGSRNAWDLLYYWDCSPGTYATPTVLGTYTVAARGYSFGDSTFRAYYYTQFYGNYLFHSTLYNLDGTDQDSRLGLRLSHGCVRLDINNAYWLYTNIPTGTKVVTY